MTFKRGEEVLVLAERSPESIRKARNGGYTKEHYVLHYLIDNSVAQVLQLLTQDRVQVYGLCVEVGCEPSLRSQVVHRSQIKLI